MEKFSALSIETVRVPVSATDDTGALVTLTGDSVSMAFMPVGSAPSSGDWHTAAWDTDASTAPVIQLVSVLIGPGEIPLTAAVWQPWVKIVDAPETKVGTAAECILVY